MTSSTRTDSEQALAGLSPEQVAEKHYQAVIDGDRELWVATLSARNRSMVDKRGARPEFWWETGRSRATEFGVTYSFRRVDQEEPEYRKLFFDRWNADGSPRGRPVPIHMVLEEEGWRVNVVAY